MISYAKSAAVPRSLDRGIAANAANCAAYDADLEAYRSGVLKFKITKNIYGTSGVKRRLKADQHNKCCFCEAIFDANVAGDVEHYRPKTAIASDEGRLYPGYYWLGYAWSNLSYACPDCNEYRKRDRFPLATGDRRARDHHDDIANEDPLLLDPYGKKDPRQHIVFRGEAPIGVTPEGRTTITILALDRTTLSRDRLHHLRQLSTKRMSVLLLKDDPRPDAVALVAQLRACLAASVEATAKFSAASADLLAALDAGEDFLPEEPLPAA